MRRTLLISLVLTACASGGQRCNVCTVCPSATAQAYYDTSTLHAVVCACESPHGTIYAGFDVARKSDPIDVTLDENDCENVEAMWTKAVAAAGGACANAAEASVTLYGTPICN